MRSMRAAARSSRVSARPGSTRYCVRREFGGALADFDARAICLIRETLAYHDGLADFAFAMQGLGSGAISLAGAARRCRRAICRGSPAARRSRRSRCPSPMPGRMWRR